MSISITSDVLLPPLLAIGILILLGMAVSSSRRSSPKPKPNKESFSSAPQQQTIVLLGDSMLNNANYVPQGQSIYDQIKQQVPATFQFAQDNAQIQTVAQHQLPTNLPNAKKWNNTNTLFVLSAGGNHLLAQKPHQLSRAQIQDWFAQWLTLVQTIKTQFPSARLAVLNLYQPASTVYTPYKPFIDQWNDLMQQQQQQTTGSKGQFILIDVHKLLTTAADFVSEVEPSTQGGAKIANAIVLASRGNN